MVKRAWLMAGRRLLAALAVGTLIAACGGGNSNASHNKKPGTHHRKPRSGEPGY